MVGVPKSTGCFICRKRKIKCDETWPNCINCQKNGKCCPGPPARHTFKDFEPRTNSEDSLGVVANSQNKKLTQLNERWSDNGAVAHKFKIIQRKQRKLSRSLQSSKGTSPAQSPRSFLSRLPSLSRHQGLAQAFVEALGTGGAGHRLSVFGPFIRDIPGRIGYNTALDAAVGCLVDAHSTLVHLNVPREIVNPELYLRAVQTLQNNLEDPQQGLSSNTLCATVLLGIVEALAGPRVGNRYLAHVGGAGKLIELQGPEHCQDQFAKEILKFNRGGIIITSIYERKPCFLTTPQWCDIAFDTTGLGFDDCLYTEVLHRMAEFPSLLEELKKLEDLENGPTETLPEHNLGLASNVHGTFCDFRPETFSPSLGYLSNPFATSNTYETARSQFFDRLYHLKISLGDLGQHLTAKLADRSAAIELPAVEKDSPIPTAFHFSNWRVTVAYNCYWSLLILTNRLLCKLLPPHDPTRYALEAECQTVAYEICKTWEDAWATRPIGALHIPLSFVLAHEFCDPDVQEWILKGLNALLEQQHVNTFRWSDDVIQMMSGQLGGKGPDFVFSNVK
ncbi:hypothetical protein P280DRAFT_490424 [Massarina eburnea CBS 473.64]|uniref:Zn(2)-C6 fungal-type domain-containing protein n=1 Tax=Massarina eburnea CBS 473.64 TaxID=1395130 RepID=A0A6A6RWT0_9PLEO|nr:hypothetical protein P280DRAFT_490424 [Massarina eburnea CBS 473.64]